MTRTEIVILVVLVVALVVGLLGAGIFSKKKKKSKPAEQKKTTKTEQKEEKKDTTFKIAKKDKSVKISKKAIKNNARSGMVERVYEKTYEPDKDDDSNMFIEIPLGKQSEDIYKEYQDFEDAGKKKVVSLGELKRQNSKTVETDKIPEENFEEEIPVRRDLPKFRPRANRQDGADSEMFGFERYKAMQQSREQQDQQTQDYSDMIETDAILHRRGIKLKR